MGNKLDVYEIVTERVMNQLEKGKIPWQHFLKDCKSIGLATNIISKKEYRGSNIWLLSCHDYTSNLWGSYKQLTSLGKQVKKGEKGTPIIFWKIYETEGKESKKVEKFPVLRYSTVFNLAQTEGYVAPSPSVSEDGKFAPLEAVESTIASFPLGFPKAQVSNDSRAFYRPSTDEMYLPDKDRFTSLSQYYSVYFHESIHATGHERRLNRLVKEARFGSNEYSKEELVAEMGASFLCQKVGIFDVTFENSAAYIGEWLARLRNDKKLIISASALAQKAVEYLTKQEEKESE